MAEYIEREALIAELSKGTIITDDIYGMGIMTGLNRALKVARKIPAADVVEVFRGEWLICADGYYPYCSRCGKEPKNGELTNYCPDCGARMDGDA